MMKPAEAETAWSTMDRRSGYILPQARKFIWPLINERCVHNESLTVVLWQLRFGQCRIHLVDSAFSEEPMLDGKRPVVRRLLTYQIGKAKVVAGVIIAHESPVNYCDNIWKLWAGRKTGNVIHLDPPQAPEGNDDGF